MSHTKYSQKVKQYLEAKYGAISILGAILSDLKNIFKIKLEVLRIMFMQ